MFDISLSNPLHGLIDYILSFSCDTVADLGGVKKFNTVFFYRQIKTLIKEEKMFRKIIGCFFLSILLTAIAIAEACAKEIPWHHSRAKYFYVFGPDGDPLLGADDHELTLFIDMPAHEKSDLVIDVYDPDTGGNHDFRTDPSNPWDTVTEFSVYGKSMIEKKEFGEGEYNRKYYRFGPYKKEQGQSINDVYRFKVIAKAITGDDANLFRYKISPRSADVFSDNITIRLLPNEGDKMFFYPEISSGTDYITIANYDLDEKGGTSELFAGSGVLFKESWTKHDVKDSLSGEWKKTRIPIGSTTGGRLKYVITKGTQKYAHAGIKVYDDKGNLLPIYFEQGKAPVPVVHSRPVPEPVPVRAVTKPVKDFGCNKFTFDATESYDITNRPLSFEWDFGDGNTSTKPIVTHVYEKGGNYTVTLTVRDDSGLGCDTAATTQTIRVNTPPKADFTMPDLACLSDEILFDASKTKDDTSTNLTYMWDFGDGTKAEGLRVRKRYEKGGTYKVTLSVDDNENSTCSTDSISKSIRINTPPVAHAGRDIDICLDDFKAEYRVNFDASGSYDADKDRLTYSWDLGDGTSKQGVKVTHIYQRPGRYNVTLTVDDGVNSACSIAKDTIAVDLNKSPVADIKTKDSKICVGDEVIFDGSGSLTEEGEKLSYMWDFGDGTTANGVKATHIYKKGGKYYPRLVVNDNRKTICSEAIATVFVDVNTAPIARIDGPRVVCMGRAIEFDGSKSSDPDGDSLKYSWSFGDEQAKHSRAKASHTFRSPGTHTVRLIVDDGRGYECSQSTATMSVRVNRPPVAHAGANLACCVDERNYFDASGSIDPDGDKLTYNWDFGDGKKATGEKVAHIYEKPGVYKVTLTVDDGSGTECSSSTSSFMVNVNIAPVPIIKIR
jgi:large repetitive protein